MRKKGHFTILKRFTKLETVLINHQSLVSEAKFKDSKYKILNKCFKVYQ